jgi:hypothetical protein
MNPRFERQVQPIGMLRWSSTAAMGKLHCGIASAWQSRLRIDAVEKVEIWECPFFLPRGQLSENPRWICYRESEKPATLSAENCCQACTALRFFELRPKKTFSTVSVICVHSAPL